MIDLRAGLVRGTAVLLCSLSLLGCPAQPRNLGAGDDIDVQMRMADLRFEREVVLNAPQFNDAQRFPVVLEQGSALQPGPDARLWALVYQPGAAFSAAAIVHIGSGSAYPGDWGLPTGWSCVQLRSTAGGFEAHHSPALPSVATPAEAADACRAWTPSGTATWRTVTPVSLGPGPQHHTPVVRWHWDTNRHQPYIGVACGPATWCQVAPYATAYSPRPAPAGVKANSPGWYDEQILYVGLRGGRYSAVLARIYPALDLDFQPVCGSTPVTNRHVATIVYDSVQLQSAVQGTPSDALAYVTQDLWRFPAGAPPIAFGEAVPLYANCVGGTLMTYKQRGATRSVDRETDPHDHRTELSEIQAMLGTGAGASRYNVPGTARWRDTGTQLGSWYGCDGQCCQVQMD